MSSGVKYFSSAWRDMAHVPRWAILRKNRTQSLAEHSYYVSLYALHVAQIIGWRGNYASLLSHALYHDMDETVSGDIPGPYKRTAVDKSKGRDATARVLSERFGYGVVNKVLGVDDEIKAIISVADTIDELCYLIEEVRSGNSWVKPVLTEVRVRLKRRWQLLPAVERVLDETWKESEPLLWDDQFNDPVLLKDPT